MMPETVRPSLGQFFAVFVDVVLGPGFEAATDDSDAHDAVVLASGNLGPNTASHLRRTDSFANTPDILVNSFYDPDIDEGAAFEELIGFHGGLGGKQAEPFVLFPTGFPIDAAPPTVEFELAR
jgi:hypothetical protein